MWKSTTIFFHRIRALSTWRFELSISTFSHTFAPLMNRSEEAARRHMSIACSRIMDLARNALAFVRRGRRSVGPRRELPNFDNRQAFALLALRRCFGTDNRWIVSIPLKSAKGLSELEQRDWRELARMFTERL